MKKLRNLRDLQNILSNYKIYEKLLYKHILFLYFMIVLLLKFYIFYKYTNIL